MRVVLTCDLAQPRSFVLQQSDLNLRNIDGVGIQDKLQVNMSHHAGLGQDQLKDVFVPAGAAETAEQRVTSSQRHEDMKVTH